MVTNNFDHSTLSFCSDKDKFGSSISLADDTLAVGGMGYNSSAGAAYIFTVSRSGIFQADQRILHPEQVHLHVKMEIRTSLWQLQPAELKFSRVVK